MKKETEVSLTRFVAEVRLAENIPGHVALQIILLQHGAHLGRVLGQDLDWAFVTQNSDLLSEFC